MRLPTTHRVGSLLEDLPALTKRHDRIKGTGLLLSTRVLRVALLRVRLLAVRILGLLRVRLLAWLRRPLGWLPVRRTVRIVASSRLCLRIRVFGPIGILVRVFTRCAKWIRHAQRFFH